MRWVWWLVWLVKVVGDDEEDALVALKRGGETRLCWVAGLLIGGGSGRGFGEKISLSNYQHINIEHSARHEWRNSQYDNGIIFKSLSLVLDGSLFTLLYLPGIAIRQ